MIVLVPVSRYRVRFEVASGRPYSVLERLILDAVREGATSLESLHGIFQIPHRLLIEALVTLTQAGWLAVGGKEEPGFVLTAESHEALVSGQEPRSSLVVEDRSVLIVMEHLTGGLILNRQIFLQTAKDIRERPGWDKSLQLRPHTGVLDRPHLDQSEVQHLLPRGKGEWIRSIGPIGLADRGMYWVAISVDLTTERIVGLPDTWRARLQPVILKEVRGHEASLDRDARELVWTPPPKRDVPDSLQPPPPLWPTRLSREDLLFSAPDHAHYLDRVLAMAHSSVFIASAFANIASLQMYKDALLNALIRGVDIDLLWGYEEGPGTIAWLHQLSRMAQTQGSKGKVCFNRDRSQAHAKLILWDHDGTFEACVGSNNWLSARPPDSEAAWNDHRITNVSIVLRHPGLVSSLCRCAAAFWQTAQSALLTSTTNRWTRIGADIEEQAVQAAATGGTGYTLGLLAGEEPNAKIRVVLDAEHEYLLDQWFTQAERRILVASHKLGPPALRRLRLVAENPRVETMQFGGFYGEADLRGNAFDEISQLVVKSGGCLAEFSGLHAKVFVSDDLACITSFNPLYGAPFTESASDREVGIVVEGAEPASWLWNQYRSEPEVDGET